MNESSTIWHLELRLIPCNRLFLLMKLEVMKQDLMLEVYSKNFGWNYRIWLLILNLGFLVILLINFCIQIPYRHQLIWLMTLTRRQFLNFWDLFLAKPCMKELLYNINLRISFYQNCSIHLIKLMNYPHLIRKSTKFVVL